MGVARVAAPLVQAGTARLAIEMVCAPQRKTHEVGDIDVVFTCHKESEEVCLNELIAAFPCGVQGGLQYGRRLC